MNYVYGTSGVLRALETVSLTAQEYCNRAVSWLRQVQKADGSFGESLNSYEAVSTKGQGNSTPSQTAWGLIGLLAGADPDDPAIAKPPAIWCNSRMRTDPGAKKISQGLAFLACST